MRSGFRFCLVNAVILPIDRALSDHAEKQLDAEKRPFIQLNFSWKQAKPAVGVILQTVVLQEASQLFDE